MPAELAISCNRRLGTLVRLRSHWCRFCKPVIVLFCALLALFAGCAQQVGPTGGPPDKTPPSIENVLPTNNSTNVPLDQVVEFEFSEGMERKSLEKALFIAPDPGDRIKIKWKRRGLRLTFTDSLRSDRTYVVTLGTDLTDLRRNALAKSFTLAFSTGDRLNKGKITGRVHGTGMQGVLIWAYLLEDDQSPDPARESAAYVTQADGSGKFELSNLSQGRYRVFAISDDNSDRFFELGADGLGVPPGDVEVVSDSVVVDNINFKISKQDTLGPALVAADAVHRMHVTVRFDEIPAAGTVSAANFRIVEVKQGDSLLVELAYLNPADSLEVELMTGEQAEDAKYRVAVRGLTDLAGNTIDPEFNSLEFDGSARPDTLRPGVDKTVPQDSARAVFSTNIDVFFNKPVRQRVFPGGFSLLGPSGSEIAGQGVWLSPVAFRFKPNTPFASNQTYTAAVSLGSLIDMAGRAAGADSTFRFLFTAINRDTLSTLGGVIADPDSSAVGAIFVTAHQNRKDGAVYTQRLAAPGEYRFEDILPGTYLLEAFRDSDGDGEYSFGSTLPFSPAERFVVYPDSVKIRARWPNEGNDVSFTD